MRSASRRRSTEAPLQTIRPLSIAIARSANAMARSICCSTRTMAISRDTGELGQPLHDLVADDRGDSLQRLVEQEDRRGAEQRAREREHLLLAPGEPQAGTGPALREPRKHRISLGDVGARPALEACQQILLDRQRAENPACLRHVAETALGAERRPAARKIGAVQENAAPMQGGEPHERGEQRRLADAVAPEDREPFSGGDRKGNVRRRSRSSRSRPSRPRRQASPRPCA